MVEYQGTVVRLQFKSIQLSFGRKHTKKKKKGGVLDYANYIFIINESG